MYAFWCFWLFWLIECRIYSAWYDVLQKGFDASELYRKKITRSFAGTSGYLSKTTTVIIHLRLTSMTSTKSTERSGEVESRGPSHRLKLRRKRELSPRKLLRG